MARQAEKGRYSDCDRTVKYDAVNNNNNGLCLDGNMENFNARETKYSGMMQGSLQETGLEMMTFQTVSVLFPWKQ